MQRDCTALCAAAAILQPCSSFYPRAASPGLRVTVGISAHDKVSSVQLADGGTFELTQGYLQNKGQLQRRNSGARGRFLYLRHAPRVAVGTALLRALSHSQERGCCAIASESALACSGCPKVVQSVPEVPSRDVQVALRPLRAEALSMSWPVPPREPGNNQYTTLENGKKYMTEDFSVSFIHLLISMCAKFAFATFYSRCLAVLSDASLSRARPLTSPASPLPLLSVSLFLQSADPLHDSQYRQQFLHVDGTITEAMLKLLQENNPMGGGVRVCARVCVCVYVCVLCEHTPFSPGIHVCEGVSVVCLCVCVCVCGCARA